MSTQGPLTFRVGHEIYHAVDLPEDTHPSPLTINGGVDGDGNVVPPAPRYTRSSLMRVGVSRVKQEYDAIQKREEEVAIARAQRRHQQAHYSRPPGSSSSHPNSRSQSHRSLSENSANHARSSDTSPTRAKHNKQQVNDQRPSLPPPPKQPSSLPARRRWGGPVVTDDMVQRVSARQQFAASTSQRSTSPRAAPMESAWRSASSPSDRASASDRQQQFTPKNQGSPDHTGHNHVAGPAASSDSSLLLHASPVQYEGGQRGSNNGRPLQDHHTPHITTPLNFRQAADVPSAGPSLQSTPPVSATRNVGFRATPRSAQASARSPSPQQQQQQNHQWSPPVRPPYLSEPCSPEALPASAEPAPHRATTPGSPVSPTPPQSGSGSFYSQFSAILSAPFVGGLLVGGISMLLIVERVAARHGVAVPALKVPEGALGSWFAAAAPSSGSVSAPST